MTLPRGEYFELHTNRPEIDRLLLATANECTADTAAAAVWTDGERTEPGGLIVQLSGEHRTHGMVVIHGDQDVTGAESARHVDR